MLPRRRPPMAACPQVGNWARMRADLVCPPPVEHRLHWDVALPPGAPSRRRRSSRSWSAAGAGAPASGRRLLPMLAGQRPARRRAGSAVCQSPVLQRPGPMSAPLLCLDLIDALEAEAVAVRREDVPDRGRALARCATSWAPTARVRRPPPRRWRRPSASKSIILSQPQVAVVRSGSQVLSVVVSDTV